MATDTSTDQLARISQPSRLAADDEGISSDELALAARNHGMPLEALQWDITPVGMHYLLTHYDIPCIDPSTWRLTVEGLVDHPMTLSLEQLHALPRVTQTVTMECAGNGRARMLPRPISQPWLHEAVGTMQWTGAALAPLLRDAGVSRQASYDVFTGADHGVERGIEQDYQRALVLDDALRDEVLLAYECNGAALPPQHGSPLRLVVPGWYGMASVKWLRSIEVTDTDFDGFQMRAYRLRQDSDDPGEPVTRIEPRALVVPPGWPDFQSRRRFLRAGAVQLVGRAWSGWGEVTRVEVTTDGGASWAEAEMGDQLGSHAWRSWRFTWRAEPETYVVSARATDATGRRQPEEAWNRGGFTNTTVQQVEVLVLDP